MMLYAVFSGDLIGSSKASPSRLEATMANLAATARFFTEYTGHDTKFTRFRGDGWQMILSPAYYLRAVALILARLKADREALSTRFGIGIGPVDTLGTYDLSDAQGPAFTHSGHALDSLTRDKAMTLAGDIPSDLLLDARAERLRETIAWSDAALLPMLSFIAHRWSHAQAEAVARALKDDRQTQATIAADLGITRQAVNLRLTGAGYVPVLTAIKLTETCFVDIIRTGAPAR